MFQQPQLSALVARLRSTPRFLQILAGPRQVGKTAIIEPTISRDVMVLPRIDKPALMATKCWRLKLRVGVTKALWPG